MTIEGEERKTFHEMRGANVRCCSKFSDRSDVEVSQISIRSTMEVQCLEFLFLERHYVYHGRGYDCSLNGQQQRLGAKDAVSQRRGKD